MMFLLTNLCCVWAACFLQRYYFEGLGYKLADSATAAWPLVKRLLPRSTARTLVVFAMSGLLHEYLTWGAW